MRTNRERLEAAFAPDLSVRFVATMRGYVPDTMKDREIMRQVTNGLTFVMEADIDRLIACAGRHGLTVETIKA